MFTFFKSKSTNKPSVLAQEERELNDKKKSLLIKERETSEVFDWKTTTPGVMENSLVWRSFLKTLSPSIRRGMSLAIKIKKKEYMESLSMVSWQKQKSGNEYLFVWGGDSKNVFYSVCR